MSSEPWYRWLLRADAFGRAAETALLTVLLLALVAVTFGQIILRNIFATGLAWADGSAQVLVLWIAVAGALAATRDHRHIAINLSARLLPTRWHRWVLVLVQGFAAIVTGAFTWQTLRFVGDSREFGDVLLGGVPAWWLQSVLPVGFALIAFRFALQAIGHCMGRHT